MAVRAAVSLKKEKTRAMEVKNWEACSKHIVWFHCNAEEACLCPRCDVAVHSSNCASAKHIPRELTLNDDKKSSCTSSEKLVFQSFAGATEVMTCAPFDSCRRPRTSWGRPHSEYSSLLNRSFHRAGIFLPSLNLHRHLKENKLPSFLADMDLPLHDMPKFTDADEDEDEYDYCLKFAPPFHTDDGSKLTPYSHSPPLSSCSTVGFTPNKFTSTVLTEDCTVDGLWTDGLIDLQRDLQQILGENRVSLYPVKAEQESENIYPPRNKIVIASRTTSTSSDGCSTAEEDYTINLSDFEPDENMTHFEGDLIHVKPEFDQVFPNRLYLNLDFDAVLTGWSSRDSPWIGGSRPDEGLVLQYLENAGMPVTDCSYIPYSSWPMVNVNAFPINEIPSAVNFQNWGKKLNREAKVLRFRERRRNRLFSKTIRYEVRKRNAEKRPRMKGRFIKRMHGASD